jgi:hypothetical protein
MGENPINVFLYEGAFSSIIFTIRKKAMKAAQLKQALHQRIAAIDDTALLTALNTLLDATKHSLPLNAQQIEDIMVSKAELAEGKYFDQDSMDKAFNQWLKEK